MSFSLQRLYTQHTARRTNRASLVSFCYKAQMHLRAELSHLRSVALSAILVTKGY